MQPDLLRCDRLRDRILELLYESIEDLNAMLPPEEQLAKSEQEILSGENAGLDSMGWVNLILITEEKLNTAFGLELSLAEPLLLDSPDGPPSTVAGMAKRLSELLEG